MRGSRCSRPQAFCRNADEYCALAMLSMDCRLVSLGRTVIGSFPLRLCATIAPVEPIVWSVEAQRADPKRRNTSV